MKTAVLVSGGGTNLQALLDSRQQMPDVELALVISSKPGVRALERARLAGVPSLVLERKAHPDREEFTRSLVGLLRTHQIGMVVFAGFLVMLSPDFCQAFEGRAINVHPSLIPAFCGEGFYGLRPHEAALARGVKVSGATVHIVNDVIDGGEILLQKAVDVREDDTPETLQRRVMEQAEWELLPRAAQLLARRLEEQDRQIQGGSGN